MPPLYSPSPLPCDVKSPIVHESRSLSLAHDGFHAAFGTAVLFLLVLAMQLEMQSLLCVSYSFSDAVDRVYSRCLQFLPSSLAAYTVPVYRTARTRVRVTV